MTELDELIEAKQEIERELTLEYEKYKKIIDCLNALEKIIDQEFCCTLTIDKRDIFVVFNLVKKKIEYIKDSLLIPNSLEAFCLKAFELLFMGKNNFDYDQLDKKVNIFQIILQALMNKPEEEKELNYINEVINKKIAWKGLIEKIKNNFGFVAFIFSVFLDFAKTKREIIEILLNFLRLIHIHDFEVKFDVNNINDINDVNITEDFMKLFEDKTEFFYLDYKNGHIVKKLLKPDETIKTLNESTDDGSAPNKKKKNKNKKKNDEDDSDSKIKDINGEAKLENEDKKEDKKEDKLFKAEMKEIKKNEEDEIWNRLNAIEEQIKMLKSENEKFKKENKITFQNMQKEIDEGKLTFQNMQKEIDEGKLTFQNMQKEIDEYKLNSQKMEKKFMKWKKH